MADMILKNGKVLSVNKENKTGVETAVLIRDGLIEAVGNDEDILQYAEEDTRIIDCSGNTIMPGICDAHCHPSTAANVFISCQLFDITATAEETCDQVIKKYMDRIEKYCDEHKDYDIIKGNGWNRAFFMNICKEKRWPTRHDLDRVCSDRPVILESYCLHCIWVNSKAIELAGLSEETPDPETGEIIRETDGYPSGIFFDVEATNLIKNNIAGYDYTVEQYKETLKRYQKECALCYGITLTNDCLCTENALQAYKELAMDGELQMRFRGVYLLEHCGVPEEVEAIKMLKGRDNVNDTFEINTIKIFLEGEFSMLEPYEKDFLELQGLPENYSGENFFDDDNVKESFVSCMDTGMQIHIHAMGDKAVRQAVRCLAYAQQKTGMQNRNVIAHLMKIDDEDLKLMGENNIVANLQPRWMIYDSEMEDSYIGMFGRKRALDMYPCRRFYDAGCIVSYGTDFPVTPPPNPFHEIQCAITRSVFAADEAEYERYKGTILGNDETPTAECVSLEDAVRSITWAGAYQNFLEDVTGSIEVGKSADIAVLDADIEEADVDRIYDIGVAYTLFKGNIVYEK